MAAYIFGADGEENNVSKLLTENVRLKKMLGELKLLLHNIPDEWTMLKTEVAPSERRQQGCLQCKQKETGQQGCHQCKQKETGQQGCLQCNQKETGQQGCLQCNQKETGEQGCLQCNQKETEQQGCLLYIQQGPGELIKSEPDQDIPEIKGDYCEMNHETGELKEGSNDLKNQNSMKPSSYKGEGLPSFNASVSKKRKLVSLKCEECDFLANSKSVLRHHIRVKHLGIRYPCDQCNFASTTSNNLKKHKQSIHEGIRYPCDQCDYNATVSSHLKRHVKAMHSEMKSFHPCDQCDFESTSSANLRQHKRRKHDATLYPCNQCSYVSAAMGDLKRHTQNQHTEKTCLNLMEFSDNLQPKLQDDNDFN